MDEHKRQPLAAAQEFYIKVVKNLLFAAFILAIYPGIGIMGYHYTEQVSWLDALHNASMILSGMVPVVEITTVSGKWFSSFYSLFSGIAFITITGVILAPVLHRLFHKLHLDGKLN